MKRAAPFLLTLLVHGLPKLAMAQDAVPSVLDEPARYLLGVSVASRPDFEGASAHRTSVRPLWAVQWGRWRLSTGGGSALLGFGRDSGGAGASTLLWDRSQLRLGVALRLDSGRSSNDSRGTQGLPDVPRTVRGRIYANYSFAPNWSAAAHLSQDLLGRRGGLMAGIDLGWRFYRSPTLEWASGVGLSAGDAQNLRSYFGVPASAVLSSGKPAYEPGAGLRDLHVGVSFTRPISPHWVAFGGAGANRLIGPAAGSPLIQQRNGNQANLGLAWRN